MIEISKKEYVRLKKAELMVEMLQCGGVDNWAGEYESLNPEGEQNYWELCEQIEKEFGE